MHVCLTVSMSVPPVSANSRTKAILTHRTVTSSQRDVMLGGDGEGGGEGDQITYSTKFCITCNGNVKDKKPWCVTVISTSHSLLTQL